MLGTRSHVPLLTGRPLERTGLWREPFLSPTGRLKMTWHFFTEPLPPEPLALSTLCHQNRNRSHTEPVIRSLKSFVCAGAWKEGIIFYIVCVCGVEGGVHSLPFSSTLWNSLNVLFLYDARLRLPPSFPSRRYSSSLETFLPTFIWTLTLWNTEQKWRGRPTLTENSKGSFETYKPADVLCSRWM